MPNRPLPGIGNARKTDVTVQQGVDRLCRSNVRAARLPPVVHEPFRCYDPFTAMNRNEKEYRNRRRKNRRSWIPKDLDAFEDLLEFDDFDWDDLAKIRRKFVVRTAKSKDTGFPIGIGIALLIAAVTLNMSPILMALLPLVGAILLVAGIGSLTTRLFRGLRRFATGTFKRFFESNKSKQQRQLAELEQRLIHDGEPRTEYLLRKLSQLYDRLQKDVQSGELTFVAKEVLANVDRVNTLCIDNLDESHQLWEQALASPHLRESKLTQREAVIQEVVESVQHLETVVHRLQEQSLNRNRMKLKQLRTELDETLDVARRVEERTAAITRPPIELEHPLE